ncbi:FUSC family protein [Pseudarthrobacter sp. NIBRBAC000502772]|uniref:FUSC family protein n=1 Tax=Pseudarthrobacter sp. NIBRBAC000502772 TaxID=2590775 RepID=UPI00113091AB|nr:FUSC family protein [Pseudarthrobacter sp. NIBRBAC000502772]QDG65288.1 FUSC family protein [Pseudarthrobacter sp. NIBRBAC000502772]
MPLVPRAFRALLTLGPARSDHRAALRLAISGGVPALALLVGGRPDLIIYAAFGAFAGRYGRDEPHQLRVIHQAQAAAMLVAGVTIGISLAAIDVRPWALVATAAVLAAAGSVVADKIRLKPAGPFFAIFALGACASVPLAVPWWCATLICLGSAGFSVLIGFAGWIGVRAWQPGASRAVAPADSPAARIHALRYLLAVGAAGSAGLLMGIGHHYWAMAAAAVPLAAETLRGRIQRGVHGVIGTLAGVGGTALILLLQPSVTVLALVVIVLQFPTELFMARQYGLALVFFTPLILMMTLLANPSDPARLIADRALETLVGVAAGVILALCIREPRQTRRDLP